MSALRALLAVALGAAMIGCPSTLAGTGDAVPPDSRVTVSGTGAFSGLTVTVSRTKNLINQTITVSWTGGHPTLPSGGDFGANYLQIMQCWGDDPNGPDRTQCQYGVLGGDSPAAGSYVRSRSGLW
jgi:hypothetical protein